MAFTQATFNPVAPNSSNAPRFWSYRTLDTASQVLTPGYFHAKRHQLETDDFIWVAASDEQYIIRYIDNDSEPEIIAPRTPVSVLVANDDTDQEPSATDTPIQITFGPAQFTIDDPVMVDADGLITFNQAGYYDVIATYRVGRQGSSGQTANIFIRGLLNGEQIGRPIATLVDNTNIEIPEQFTLNGFLEAGDTVTTEVYRDSNGPNEGGLFIADSSIGWGISSSAVIRVFKLR